MTVEVTTNNPIVDAAAREAAVRGMGHNIVVTAGAGTGKTSLLIERVLHLVLEFGIPLQRLAAITFTEKAAAEMRERLESALESVLGSEVPSDEAKRVLDRLRESGIDIALILERARLALECIDDGTITTIHSFAGELLRRHPGEAGVDPNFQVDEGPRQDEIFREIWRATLRSVFERSHDDGVRKAWEALLDRFSIADIESMAIRLSGFKFAPEVFDDKNLGEQNGFLRTQVAELLAEVQRLAALTSAVEGVSDKFNVHLGILTETFCDFLDNEAVPDEDLLTAAGLASGACTVGKKADFSDEEKSDADASMKSLIKAARDLCKVDLELARDVARALGPIVGRFRRQFVGQGWVTHDAIIVLARNLLRDHVSARRAESKRFDQLLIDEFQDTDPLQYEIAFFLAEQPTSAATKNAFEAQLIPGRLFIVGDPKQSIYRFRGADIRAFQLAVSMLDNQGGKSHSLRTNFRSVPEIVDPLNRLFEATFGSGRAYDPTYEALTSAVPAASEPGIEIWSVGSGAVSADERRRLEAETIAHWIAETVKNEQRRPRDVAILLRALTKVDFLLRALRRRNIPYVVEGGQEFFRRHEVELLLAFLRAVTNTADGVSLVAWLRSPAAAVSDRELQDFADAARASNDGRLPAQTWSIFSRPDAERFPRLAPALEELRVFVEGHRGAPLDVLSRAALRETSLELAMAASYEGAQRVVNLEKVVRTIGALASDGRLSSSDILERLESEGAFRSSEGDSPLADETVDAVRVLSVHKSKGLEWPVVILPNVAGDSGKGQERESVVVDVLAPRSLIVKSKRSQSPGYATFKKEKQLHEEAESRRLFYVAATRARQQLILAVGALDRGKPPWLEALGAWGYCLGSGRKWPEAESFMGGAVRHRVFEKVSEEDGRASATKLDEGLLDAVREFRQAREHASSFEDPFYHPGTELEENENDAEDAPPRPLLSGGRDRRLARAAGDTVHLLLEVWDRNDQAWLFDHVENAAVVAASRERVSTDDVASEARAILERARDDGQLRTLAGREVLGREMPILYRDDGGRLWEGKIDLLAGNPEQPEVLDYKTSRAQSVEELERKYEGQIKRYAEGVQRALDRKEPVPARIVHLPPKE